MTVLSIYLSTFHVYMLNQYPDEVLSNHQQYICFNLFSKSLIAGTSTLQFIYGSVIIAMRLLSKTF